MLEFIWLYVLQDMAHVNQVNGPVGQVRQRSDIVGNDMDMGQRSSIDVYKLRTVSFSAADVDQNLAVVIFGKGRLYQASPGES